MRFWPLIRFNNPPCAICLPVCLVAFLFAAGPTRVWTQTPQPAVPVVLDRVVAVVNNHAILSSDLDEEIRLSVLDSGHAGLGVLTRKMAVEQLIARALIQQQFRQQDMQSAEATQAEVDLRLAEIRRQLPACVHQNCVSEAGWTAFLATNGLTPGRVESYLRNRIGILRFIEERFRQDIRISQAEIETYYRQTLLPQYAKGEAIPPMEEVAPRIQEILLQRQVNVLFGDWLTTLRKQGEVEVLDPALEDPETPGNPQGSAKGGTGDGSQ
ncbi:MAG: peptidylprolyl isomerase [Terracidiphilus sp.]